MGDRNNESKKDRRIERKKGGRNATAKGEFY
jgi:hypothetical protein